MTKERTEHDSDQPTRKRYAHEIVDIHREQTERVVRTYDERGRLRSEWWPTTDAYLRISYADDGK